MDKGVYQASRWIRVPFLLGKEEMGHLFAYLGDFSIFPLSRIHDGNPISKESFLEEYGFWIEQLKQGKPPSDQDLRKLLASVFVDREDAIWLQEVSAGRFLTRIRIPTVQMQSHFIAYSSLDQTFRSMSYGPETIFWGVQCAFPQIYQDPHTGEILEVDVSPLFQKMRQWVREHTRATPFQVGSLKTNVPVRLGKEAFSWIHLHPQLKGASYGDISVSR